MSRRTKTQLDEMPPSTEVAADATAPDGTAIEVQRNYGKPRTAAEILAALKGAKKAAKAKAPAVEKAEAAEAAAILSKAMGNATETPKAAAVEATETQKAPETTVPDVPQSDAQKVTKPAKARRKATVAKAESSVAEPVAEALEGASQAHSVESAQSAAALAETQVEAESAVAAPAPKPKPLTPAQLRARREAHARFAGMKPMHVVEAALFSAGKPLSVDEIAETTGLKPDVIKDGIKELVAAYERRADDTVLEVGKAGTKWAMQVRSRAAEPASKFAPMEIPAKVLKTLALIAYHQPMKQSELVDMIGTKVYDHVPELVERGLVRAREEGVTKILSTTALFPEYFGLDAEDQEGVRAALAKLVGLPPPAPKPTTASIVYEDAQGQAEPVPDGEATPAPEAQSAAAPSETPPQT